jgi:DNA-binding CsgD family transcriptional regulator
MQRIHARIIHKGPFTEKESQVLRYMCEGLYTTEIAVRLFRSPRTIGKHIENIAAKLNARGSSEIVLIAREMGLVEITLTDTVHPALKMILIIIMFSNLMPQYGMRRPKTNHRTSAVRLVRLQHRQ